MNKWVALGAVALALLWAPYLYKELSRETPVTEEDAVDDADDGILDEDELEAPVPLAALPVAEQEDAPGDEPEPADPPEAQEGEEGSEPDEKLAVPQPVEPGPDERSAPDPEPQGMPGAMGQVARAAAAAAEAAKALAPESPSDGEGADSPPPLPDISVPQAGPYALVKGVFDEETRDGLWASDREAALPGYLHEVGFSEDAVSGVKCHRTVCQVQLDMIDEDKAALMTLAVKLSEAGGPGIVTSASEIVGDRARVMLYMVRDGYTLQDLSRGE